MANILFHINGGCGKCIAATAVCAAIKKQHPEDSLIVVSGYPDIFTNNPNVSKSLLMGDTPYFYNDNVRDKEFIAMMQDPYFETNYINKSQHLIKTWCEMNGVAYNGEMPELFYNQREIDFYAAKYSSDKPIMMLQSNGGANPDLKYSFARDLPTSVVTKVIQHFAPRFNIVHVRREDQLGYQGVTPIHASAREIIALTKFSSLRLLIDSYLQHACAALNLPATVCWITNKPNVLGYELHKNILANPFTVKPQLRNSYIEEFSIMGDPQEFPYISEAEIFDVDAIIAALESQIIIPEQQLQAAPRSTETPAADEAVTAPPATETKAEEPAVPFFVTQDAQAKVDEPITAPTSVEASPTSENVSPAAETSTSEMHQ